MREHEATRAQPGWLAWLDERLGLTTIYQLTLDRMVPKVNWWYTLGSATLFVFILQIVTGMFLLVYYTPSPDHAYDSIEYIMTEVPFGWLIRGIHHWGASLMVLLVFLHMLRVFYMAAYRYPRELTWVIGVFLFLFTIGMGFTGYLLPWNQRSFFATVVGTNLAGTIPYIGDFVKRVLRGGETVSALTLSRFFAVHVWILPSIMVLLVVMHLYLVVRLGISNPPAKDE